MVEAFDSRKYYLVLNKQGGLNKRRGRGTDVRKGWKINAKNSLTFSLRIFLYDTIRRNVKTVTA